MIAVDGPPVPLDLDRTSPPGRATPPAGAPTPSHPAAQPIGWLAIAASATYLVSDTIEVAQGGFSTLQLWLTLAGEAAVPVFVAGFVVVLGRRLGTVGRIAAVGYAYAYVVFTGTVVYALVQGTVDYEELNERLGVLMIAHGAVMVVAGVCLGAVVVRRRLFPVGAGVFLIAGVILVAATQGTWAWLELGAAAVRATAFGWFGVSLLGEHLGRPHHDHVM